MLKLHSIPTRMNILNIDWFMLIIAMSDDLLRCGICSHILGFNSYSKNAIIELKIEYFAKEFRQSIKMRTHNKNNISPLISLIVLLYRLHSPLASGSNFAHMHSKQQTSKRRTYAANAIYIPLSCSTLVYHWLLSKARSLYCSFIVPSYSFVTLIWLCSRSQCSWLILRWICGFSRIKVLILAQKCWVYAADYFHRAWKLMSLKISSWKNWISSNR